MVISKTKFVFYINRVQQIFIFSLGKTPHRLISEQKIISFSLFWSILKMIARFLPLLKEKIFPSLPLILSNLGKYFSLVLQFKAPSSVYCLPTFATKLFMNALHKIARKNYISGKIAAIVAQ